MSRTVVICVGNPFRHDDGVASAVAELARRRLPGSVAVVELDGEPARMVDAWAGAALAVVVDAVRSGDPAGTIRRIDLRADGPLPTTRPASTHGYSIGDAVELGRAVGQLPARLVVYGVEGHDFTEGPGLSDLVAGAVPAVVERLVGETAAAGAPVPGSGVG